MAKSTRRVYGLTRPNPDPAQALLEADLCRIALRRQFEGWGPGTGGLGP